MIPGATPSLPHDRAGTRAARDANAGNLATRKTSSQQPLILENDVVDGRGGPRSRASITDFLHPKLALSSHAGAGGRDRLIIVSNRLAVPREVRAGGLASALKGALADEGGIWFGWSGETAAEPRFDVQSDPVYPIHYATLDLEPGDYDDYYTGFANRVLWPLFHYRLDLLEFRREALTAYRRVSAKFAERIAALVKPEDTIWVH